MESRVQKTLEYDKIRALLAEQASFSVGKHLAESLTPSTSLRQVERHQQETAEALQVLDEAGAAPFGGLRDVRTLAKRATLGAVLQPDQLLEVAETIRASRRLRSFLLDHGPEYGAPILTDLAGLLGNYTRLENEVRRCIDAEAHVVDHASPQLASIRSKLRSLRQKVRDHLDRLVRSNKGQRFLQEQIVTLRDGRYVVPVKQEYRGEIPGLVHAQSASGATLFVEPLPVVEANNQVREEESREEQEVERILAALSAMVAEEEQGLIHTVEIAGELDFIFAKAHLARIWDGVRPQMNEDGRIIIRKGRHPLLQGKVVPIDLTLGERFTALIITGPNTGGKTVTLKTVGLFALMAQSGLHLPAEAETEMALFKSVFADIGDEQSIEQNLSTFSSHMGNIVDILTKVDSRSLVLLDELGAGTDPTEGAALAIALLEHLVAQGSRVVATTHYSELKSFAYDHPEVENASVEFDVETLRPTYRLSIGVAGKSNAFAIATRLGLQRDVISRAEAQLSEDERKVDDLIRHVEADKQHAARDREEAQKLRRRYQELYDRYNEAFSELQAARETVLQEARAEARRLVTDARKKADELLGRLRRAGHRDIEAEANEVRKGLTALMPDGPHRPGSDSGPSDERSRPEKIEVGMPVKIAGLGQEGEVLQVLGGGKVVVQAGAMKVTVDSEDLETARKTSERAREGRAAPSSQVHGPSRLAKDVKSEIDLRGSTVDEALETIDKYLDDCVLAGLPKAWLIHGKGTGALRKAVQEYLADHPRVKAYQLGEQSEGGSGVTVVQF